MLDDSVLSYADDAVILSSEDTQARMTMFPKKVRVKIGLKQLNRVDNWMYLEYLILI